MTKGLLCALVMTVVIVFSGGGASACGCGEFHGFVVAKGKSLFGVRWRIRASNPQVDSHGYRSADFFFEMLPPAYSGVGYFTTLGLPTSPKFVFTATPGSGLDRHPEADLSGITSSKVTTLTVKMSKGAPLTIRPRLAPPGVLARHPWLSDLKFFDTFFPDSRRPVLATARDVSGKVLTRRKARQGSFFD